MKGIRIITMMAALLVTIAATAQVPTGYYGDLKRINNIAIKSDSGDHVPGYAGVPRIRKNVWTGAGNVGVDTVNHKFYFYSGGAWREAGGTGSYPQVPNPDNPNNWTIIEHKANPIFSIENMPHPGGVYQESSMYAPSPISINDTLFRVYAKGDATNSIHYWESRDSMRTWVYVDSAIYPTPSPTWDSVDIAFPLAVYDNVNDTVHLYYTGGKGIGGPDYGIGHVAFKSNASHPLTRPASPMLSHSTASSLLGVTVGFIDFSSMVKKDGKYYFFGSYSATDSVFLFAARGNSWTSVDTMWKIMSPNTALDYNGIINPTIFKRGSLYYGIFADSRVDADGVRDTSWSQLASMYSSDLKTWTRLPGWFMQPRGAGAWNEKQVYDLQFLKVNGGNYDELYRVKGDTLWGGPLKDQTENFFYGFVSGSFYGCCLDQSGIVYVLPQENDKMNFAISDKNLRNDVSFYQRNNTLVLNLPDASPLTRGLMNSETYRMLQSKADSIGGTHYIWNNSTVTPQSASMNITGSVIAEGTISAGSAWNSSSVNADAISKSGHAITARNGTYYGNGWSLDVLGQTTLTWKGNDNGYLYQQTTSEGFMEQFYKKVHAGVYYPFPDIFTIFGQQNDTMRAELRGGNPSGAGVSRTTAGRGLVINYADGYNTTGGGLTSYGQIINNTASRESGSNALTNIGMKVVASGGQNNYALQLVDGTQGTGKVLTSDANGIASWQTPSGGGSGVYVDSLYNNSGADSLIWQKNGNRYAIKYPSGGGGSGWGLSGNSITAGVDKIGTTNNATMWFITNNTKRMALDSLGHMYLGSRGSMIYDNVQLNITAAVQYPFYIDDAYYGALHFMDNSGNAYHSGTLTAAGYKSGSATGQTTTVTVVTSVRNNSGTMQKKTKLLTYTSGLITAVGTESDWSDF